MDGEKLVESVKSELKKTELGDRPANKTVFANGTKCYCSDHHEHDAFISMDMMNNR